MTADKLEALTGEFLDKAGLEHTPQLIWILFVTLLGAGIITESDIRDLFRILEGKGGEST